MAGKTPSDGRPDGAGPGAVPDLVDGPDGETWVALTDGPLPVDEVTRWIGRPDCGAVVVFRGDARDHAEGRPDVTALEYEAYESQVVPRLGRLAGEARNRWPELGRIALIHRTGPLAIGEAAVEIVEVFTGRCPVHEAASMEEAVALANGEAGGSGTVLLSPGCSSFDWYGSYVERGLDFGRIVRSLDGAGA